MIINFLEETLIDGYFNITKKKNSTYEENIYNIIGKLKKNIEDKIFKINFFNNKKIYKRSIKYGFNIINLIIKTDKNEYIIDRNTDLYFIYDNHFINLNNYKKIEEFNKETIFRIFGKGPTFKCIEKQNENENEIHVCINQAANAITECDILAINDLHNIDLINENVLRKVKYIYLPEYLHIDWRFSKNGYWLNVVKKLQGVFKGDYIVFNLFDSPNKNKTLFDIPTGISTANNFNEFLCKYFRKNIKRIEFYGIGVITRKNYHEAFKGRGKYNDRRISRIRNNLELICKKHKVKHSFN